VIFARSEDHAPLRRPLLLLLVEGYALGPGVLRAAAAALQAGFRPVVTPWFALALSECGIAAVAGFELLADEARRAIAGTEQLRPDAVAVLADVRRLGRAARVAVDGLVNASGAAVIAPLLDGAAMAAADCHGVLSFAPIRFWTAHSAADDEPEALCGALADGDARTALLAAGDPARVLLPLSLTAGQARFGFIATDGTGVDLPLLRAWLAAAAPRCAPRLPFLLPTPRFLRADAGEAPLYRTAAPMRLDPARPPGPPALAQMLPSPAAGHVFVPTARMRHSISCIRGSRVPVSPIPILPCDPMGCCATRRARSTRRLATTGWGCGWSSPASAGRSWWIIWHLRGGRT
jgi:hypothetical protein